MTERLNLHCFGSEQPPYNLLDRRIENELFPPDCVMMVCGAAQVK
jgi:aryl-alcohol dehydrogenase-like predicted oxidoreductase